MTKEKKKDYNDALEIYEKKSGAKLIYHKDVVFDPSGDETTINSMKKFAHSIYLSQVNFDYIGIKMLISREKVDLNRDYKFNFLPWFEDNDR